VVPVEWRVSAIRRAVRMAQPGRRIVRSRLRINRRGVRFYQRGAAAAPMKPAVS